MGYATHEQPFSQIGDGRKAVTTKGTRVQLSATSTKIKKVIVSALPSNTGIVVVGGITVVAASGSERGKILYPGDSEVFFADNLTKIYVDSVVDGEGVSFVYYL